MTPPQQTVGWLWGVGLYRNVSNGAHPGALNCGSRPLQEQHLTLVHACRDVIEVERMHHQRIRQTTDHSVGHQYFIDIEM